jgi:hypothetical protein
VVDVVLAGEIRLRHLSGDGIDEAGMAMRVDDRRHDGLAGEIDARRAGRKRHLAVSTDCREAAVLDDEGGILDGAAVANDESRAFEHRHGRARRLASSRP